MKNTFGSALGLTIFGESHGAGVGAVLDGMAAGVPVDQAALAALMDKRGPGATGFPPRGWRRTRSASCPAWWPATPPAPPSPF